MNVRLNSLRGAAVPAKAACALLVTAVLAAQSVLGQTSPTKLTPTPESGAAASMVINDSHVVQAGCSSCGSSLMGGSYGSSCSSCGAGSSDSCAGGCYPGRQKCDSCCLGDGFCGRFLGGILECLCCPDPCYEPHWNPLADSAFFVDAARPVTQTRIRGDFGWHLIDPDRAEYFWARETKKGPKIVPTKLDYQELSLYTEAAAGNFGLSVEIPYLHFDADGHDSKGNPINFSKSGFSDMNIGTKALLLDCELLQFAMEFKTYIPIGNFNGGLGVAHVSLEPGFLLAVKLSQQSYLQFQTALWIPIGGDGAYQSDVWHNHLSYNRALWHPCSNILLVGTVEANEWSVIGGEYTTPAGATVRGEGTMCSVGPGLRLFICDKIDTGVGSAFSVTGSHWAEDLVRVEFRMRF
jgi:hypothetical protein